MKQLFTLLTVITQVCTVFSQDYNFNFENWTNHGTYVSPDEWSSFNTLVPLGLPPGTIKSTDAASGNFALQLVTDSIPVGVAVLGVIYTSSGVIKPGRPWYSGRPDSIKLFYKNTIVAGDSSAMVFFFTKWDATADTQMIVGRAIHRNKITVPNYTEVLMPVEYFHADQPDSPRHRTRMQFDSQRAEPRPCLPV